MEPITTIAATAAVLFAKKVIDEAGGATGKALSTAAGRVVAWVLQLGRDDPEAGAAVTMVQSDPADQTRVDMLGKVLAARATADRQVAEELRVLVAAARQAGDVHVSEGGAHIHGDVTGGTVTQIGRDQINRSS